MEKNWSAQQMPRLDGMFAIVTGASSGLGYHAALELARAGAEVIMPVRDGKRGVEARARLLAEVPVARVTLETMDLASLASVRSFAERTVGAGRPLDLLVNNAGVMSLPKREVTAEGYERQFGTNHLGHFALTGLLLPVLMRARAPRVVTASSGLAAFGRIDFENLQSGKKYSPQGAYEVSKLANLMFMLELDRRARGGLISVAAHPGLAATDLQTSGFNGWVQSLAAPASAGVLPLLYASAGDDVAGGQYFGPLHWFPCNFFGIGTPPVKAKLPKRALDERVAQELWTRSEALTGVTFGLLARPEPSRARAASRGATAPS
jgi:NAD(P)-dependent dehydrogenase (short-subunit alcohol dehydrogenase family)